MDLARGVLRGAFAKADGELATVDKDDLNTFCRNLDEFLRDNHSVTSSESTECLAWTLYNIAPSASRAAALGRYLLRLVENEGRHSSNSNVTYSETGDPRRSRNSQSHEPSDKSWYSLADTKVGQDAQCAGIALSCLLFLDSVMRTAAARSEAEKDVDTFATAIASSALELVRRTALEEGKQALDLYKALHELLSWYQDSAAFDEVYIMEMRGVARSGFGRWLLWLQRFAVDAYHKLLRQNDMIGFSKDLPLYHGNKEDPWHQQPAGTILELVQRQTPISTERIRPVAMNNRDIDPLLLELVADHIGEADRIFSLTKISPYDNDSDTRLNSLGFRIRAHPVTGKRSVSETYYGPKTGHFDRLKRRKVTTILDNKAATTRPLQSQTQSSQRPYSPAATNKEPLPPPPPPPPDSISRQTENTTQFPPPPPLPYGFPGQIPPPAPPPMSGASTSCPLPLPLPPRPPNWYGPWPPPPPGPGLQGIPPPPPPPLQHLPSGYNNISTGNVQGSYGGDFRTGHNGSNFRYDRSNDGQYGTPGRGRGGRDGDRSHWQGRQ